jgi:hypothetical protein
MSVVCGSFGFFMDDVVREITPSAKHLIALHDVNGALAPPSSAPSKLISASSLARSGLDCIMLIYGRERTTALSFTYRLHHGQLPARDTAFHGQQLVDARRPRT